MKRAAATTLAVSAAAWFLARALPIDAVLLAVLLGMAVARIVGRRWRDAGTLAKGTLWAAVALLGAAVSVPSRDVAGPVVALAACAIVVAIAAAWWLRRLGLRAPMALALGVGTGVCGASAIAAVRRSVGADDDEVAESVALVTLLGLVGWVLWPLTAWLASPLGAAAWAGASLHAVPHAVGAGWSVAGPDGAALAGLVKMTRVALLPVAVVAVAWLAAGRPSWRLPSEVVAFAAVAAWARIGSESAVAWVQGLDRLLFLVGFAALGLTVSLRRTSARPALVAVLVWLAVVAATGAVLFATGLDVLSPAP